MVDKGFTARFDKGLFTFYVEQHNLPFKNKFNAEDTLANIR